MTIFKILCLYRFCLLLDVVFPYSTVRFISDLSKSFSAEVCVEGIENSGMRDELLKFDVNSLQGFYYSKPIEIEDFLKGTSNNCFE